MFSDPWGHSFRQAVEALKSRHTSIRLEGGGYRRDHLRSLAQRVEVADKEVRIMGSKSELLRILNAVRRSEIYAGIRNAADELA